MSRPPLTIVEGRAYPLAMPNIDTDAIIAGEWLKTVTRTGLGHAAFATLRAGGSSVLDDPAYASAPILIAGENFGCGSSREHAVWALVDLGVRVTIAPSFSDIFASNAFKNGLLAVVLPPEVVDRLLDEALRGPIRVDLQAQIVSTPIGARFAFEMDPFRKKCLLQGLDEIGLTLEHAGSIAAYERRWPPFRTNGLG